ncbi:MAG: iron-sulfur cluster assembly scaffold protein [Acidobacteria bacterium]|nr:MAG: iron-sulfur cluster assembly scaffold protein [Acidobacteriota bacterium]
MSVSGPAFYSATVLDHFENPRNVGDVPGSAAVATVENMDCGDRVRLSLRINDSGIILEARFRTFGCVAAIAASSMTTEMVVGLDLESAVALTDLQVAAALGGLPPSKVHCSVLAERVIRKAIENFRFVTGRSGEEERQ